MGTTRSEKHRTRRELQTVRAMIGIYCRDHHGRRRHLCAECDALWQYARERVRRCPFGTAKPTCANCPVHCYKAARREQIRAVMRYAGPRMPWRHPVLTLFHVIDGRRRSPPPRRRGVSASPGAGAPSATSDGGS